MRIRYTAREHPQGGYAVWDGDNGRWEGHPLPALKEARAAARLASEEFAAQVEAHGGSSTLGFYFGGLTRPEANAMRARLAEVAASLGYLAKAGGGYSDGKGSPSALIMAIANGEVSVHRSRPPQ